MIDWRRGPSSGRPRRSEDHVTPAQSPVKRNLASGLGRRQRLGCGLAGTGRRASQTTKESSPTRSFGIPDGPEGLPARLGLLNSLSMRYEQREPS